MNCAEFSEIINLYLAGEAPEAVRAGIEAHAKSCAGCAESLAEARAALDILKGALESVRLGEAFDAKVMQRLARPSAQGLRASAGRSGSRAFIRRRAIFKIAAVAAAVVIGILLIQPFFAGSAGTVVSGRLTKISAGAEEKIARGAALRAGDVLVTGAGEEAVVELSSELKVAMGLGTRLSVGAGGRAVLEQGSLLGHFTAAARAGINTPAGAVEARDALAGLAVVSDTAEAPSATDSAFSIFPKACAAEKQAKGSFIAAVSAIEGSVNFYGKTVAAGEVAMFTSDSVKFEILKAGEFEAELARRLESRRAAISQIEAELHGVHGALAEKYSAELGAAETEARLLEKMLDAAKGLRGLDARLGWRAGASAAR